VPGMVFISTQGRCLWYQVRQWRLLLVVLTHIIKPVKMIFFSALSKVASGKRIASPSDNATDYFHAQRLNRDSSDSEKIRADVSEASAMLDVGVSIGEKVFTNLSKMRQMVDDYYDPETSQEDKNMMKADFSRLIKEVNASTNNGIYDGKKMVQDTSATGPLKTVNLDSNDLSQTFSISFTAQQVADPSALTLGNGTQVSDAAAVDAELEKAGSCLATASAYSRGIKSQYNMLSQKILTSKAEESSIVDIDESLELAKATESSIRHQSTVAMMAQANSVRASIIKVLQF
jgi:flagellin